MTRANVARGDAKAPRAAGKAAGKPASKPASKAVGKATPARAAAKPPVPSADLLAGVMHEVPDDLREALIADADVVARWNALTPIQRNEWICWTTIVKKPETRADHVRRTGEELREGKRQPCCWPGCPHRRPNAQKWFKRP